LRDQAREQVPLELLAERLLLGRGLGPPAPRGAHRLVLAPDPAALCLALGPEQLGRGLGPAEIDPGDEEPPLHLHPPGVGRRRRDLGGALGEVPERLLRPHQRRAGRPEPAAELGLGAAVRRPRPRDLLQRRLLLLPEAGDGHLQLGDPADGAAVPHQAER
jgi:hypothetical protein